MIASYNFSMRSFRRRFLLFLISLPSTHVLSNILKTLYVIWTLPNTCLGLLVGLIGMLFGGKCQFRRGCIEFHSGPVRWLLQKMPTGSGAIAMTLGHTILGQNTNCLDVARDHEHVHVRQYERWGPLFVPAYFLSSAYLWLRKKDPYRDNPFEVEAYAKATPGASKPNDEA